jgi:outer membrane protein assembly factor BamB
MRIRRHAWTLGLVVLLSLAPFAQAGVAAPVAGETPAAGTLTNVSIYTYVCDHVPDVVSQTSLPAGCVLGSSGIGFTVTNDAGESVGSCVTDSQGQCAILAYEGEMLKIVENPETLPSGLMPGQPSIYYHVPTGPTDSVPVFINVAPPTPTPPPTATATPAPPTSTPTPAPPTATPTPTPTPKPPRKVTGTSIYLGDNGRTGRLPGDRPRGHIGIAAEVTIPGLYDAEVIVDGLLFGLKGDSNSSTVATWDIATGETVWTLSIPGGVVAAPPAVADGVVYTALSDGTALALSAGSGKEIWRAKALPQGQTGYPGVPLVDESMVIFVDGQYGSAFDRASGKRIWAIKLIADDPASMGKAYSLAFDGDDILVSPYLDQHGGATMTEVDSQTGHITGYGRLSVIGAFSTDGAYIYRCGTNEYGAGFVAAMDTRTGNDAIEDEYCGGVTIGANGTLLVGSDYQVKAYSLGLQDEIWRTDLPSELGHTVGRPLLAGGLLFQAGTSGVLALDPTSGDIAWQLPLICKPEVTGLLSIQSGRIYLTTDRGLIVLGGDAGSHKTTIKTSTHPPISNGIAVAVTKDVTLLDDASESAFPVADLKAGDALKVTSFSIQAEGKTWWRVSDSSGDSGYLPEDVLTVTGC